ncbi:MAG: amino acid permease [Acidobacteria bacterium]|nr:amino acid permease [Acidobacteriota bacterium]
MQLFREIGLLSATLLVVGNIIGIGIFTTTGLIAAEIGNSPWLLGVWILGGFLALIGAACYSLLSRKIPQAGGEYAFLYPTYGPFAAFLAGWASLIFGFSAPIAAYALALIAYLSPLLPSGLFEHSLIQKGTAGLILLGISFLMVLGLRFGSRFHSAITLLTLGLIIGFATLVLLRTPVLQNLEPILAGNLSPDLPALGTAIVMVMFAYSGWNAAVYVAEEIRRPAVYIPAALLLGTVFVTAIYVWMNLAYLGAQSLTQIEGEIAIAEITALAAFGPEGRVIVNILVLFAILSSITAMSIAGPRVYFAMSRNHLFPAWLAEVDEERRIPLKAICFQTAVALLLVAIGTFRWLLISSGFILLLFSTLTVSTLFMVRKEKDNPYFWVLHRFLPGLFVLINAVVLAVVLVSAVASNPSETIAGGVTLLVALPVYFYYKGKQKNL